MKIIYLIFSFLVCITTWSNPAFVQETPASTIQYAIDGPALCATAKETLAYLNKGQAYDPTVIHEGKIFKLSLSRIKATLGFICQHQNQLNDPHFLNKHFDFVRWYPDMQQVKKLSSQKKLLAHLPADKILMTKYYVHKAQASKNRQAKYPFALYAIPQDEKYLSIEEADKKPGLTRFQYGKQAILRGALQEKNVPVLAYLNREDLEAALLQGTLVATVGSKSPPLTFNVHRCNNIPYDKSKNPYQQERFWYFKQVAGIKGYGKDADHKITVNPGATFAADLEQFGLGKLLLIQYDLLGKTITKAGVMADTGGAFEHNQYQVDFLTGTYTGQQAFYQANKKLPDYVTAYFMVLKN